MEVKARVSNDAPMYDAAGLNVDRKLKNAFPIHRLKMKL